MPNSPPLPLRLEHPITFSLGQPAPGATLAVALRRRRPLQQRRRRRRPFRSRPAGWSPSSQLGRLEQGCVAAMVMGPLPPAAGSGGRPSIFCRHGREIGFEYSRCEWARSAWPCWAATPSRPRHVLKRVCLLRGKLGVVYCIFSLASPYRIFFPYCLLSLRKVFGGQSS